MGFEPAVAAARRFHHISLTTRDEEIRRTLSTLIAFDAPSPAMPVVTGALAPIVSPASEIRTTAPAISRVEMEDDPFPVDGLFEALTSPGTTKELLAGMAEQGRAIRRLLDAVRFGGAVVPAAILEELERVSNLGLPA